jgi:hypothetical protein
VEKFLSTDFLHFVVLQANIEFLPLTYPDGLFVIFEK